MRSNSAFTLIEVLIAVALTGLIASLALAPVVYAIRQITETEVAYSNETALRRTAAFIAQDVMAGLRLTPTVVRVIDHQRLGGGEDDTLIIASATPAKQNLAAGSLVYRLIQRSVMNEDRVSGLYRWLLPGTLPENVEYEKLKEEDGQLIAPYITELNLSVLEPPEWSDSYEGGLPRGMKFSLTRGEEQVEYVFGFPQ
ncbi:MAG: prepilin-type N-terminal cleavage/methylation domain-containing protein [Synergistaceae bacterium]|jgi:prepilin-type N-terminal cleavage/methylation domain-containing protein|nr:prepilin-type N-terminal cleavage/methylation domain-containing protein [Synergistaceae bacterium]